MKKFPNLLLLLISCVLLATLSCVSDDDTPTYETDLAKLTELKATIEALANTSTCGDTFECKYIALGSKACGGPWSYLVYSTSIDTNKLENLVENYNAVEEDFNQKWEIFSDCSLAQMPTSVSCENNTCVAMY